MFGNKFVGMSMCISVSDFLMVILYLLLDARTLSLTLYVCVFAFGSMLVNICLVYCLLKCSCHTSYIASIVAYL